MKTLKGIAQDIKGLVSGSEKSTIHQIEHDAKFEELYNSYKVLPDWIAQLQPMLQDCVDRNHDASKRNANAARDFLTFLDDERSGEKPRELAREMHDEIRKWQEYDMNGRTPIDKARQMLAKLHALTIQTNKDIEIRDSLGRDLSKALTDLDSLYDKLEHKGERAVPMDKIDRLKNDRDEARTRYNEVNRRAKQHMWKTIEATPRIVYLVLYGYSLWAADTLGLRPVTWAADPLKSAHPELRDMDRWEAEPLSGMSINEIFDKTLTADELGGNLELDTADRERLHEERIQATAAAAQGEAAKPSTQAAPSEGLGERQAPGLEEERPRTAVVEGQTIEPVVITTKVKVIPGEGQEQVTEPTVHVETVGGQQ